MPKKTSARAKNAIGDPWHYPRTDLARLFLDRFKIAGATNGTHFYAPRRRGKTQFLLLDLAPAAIRRGYTVVYASLWDNMNQPHLALLDALERAAQARRAKSGKLATTLGRALTGLKAKAALSGLELSAEMELAADPRQPRTEDLARIGQQIEVLIGAAQRNSLLLMIDEAQQLAAKPEFDPLAGKLKTLVESIPALDLVMTGSSRRGLARLFASDQPLHNVTHAESFPSLEDGFVDHLIEVFAFVTSGRKLDRDRLLALFDDVDRSPFFLRGVLEAMIIQPTLSLDAAHQRLMDAVAFRGRYEARWNNLRPLDQIVFLRAVEKLSIYNDDAFTSYRRALDERGDDSELSRGIVQSCIRRLTDRGYLSAALDQRGRYDVELPGFAEWLRKYQSAD